MNRGPDAVHPSPLALEQLLAGQGSAETTSHLLTCEACRLHLSAMEASARRFSASPKSLRAREAATKADRRWKQRAASFTTLTVAALALISLGAPRLISQHTPNENDPTPSTTPIAKAPQQQPGALRRQGREVLEPRPETWPTRMRKVPIRGRDVEFGQGALEASPDDGPSRPFTLTHTRVDINVTGFMQTVSVTQTFRNPFASPVEAVYVFPLPDDAAVHAMELHAGTRVIKAEIQKRAQARATYEQAKAEGRRAALLDQERPNIFTQSVANLLPGETVEITIQYVAPLAYDDGIYTLNFPMTVGPRYIPGAALPGESQGKGVSPDTDRVLDASRITPPVTRSGRDIEVNLHVDAGTVIEDLWTVSHKLQVDRPASARVDITLDPYDTLPNKDLIVRWRVSGPMARAAMLAAGGAFALMLNPEQQVANAPVTPKEMVFVIDTSCSMNGPPLDAAKLAMEQALAQMNPLDTFMLIDFAETASSFHDTPLPASQANVERAVQYLRFLRSRGGTNQLAGIRRALARDEDPSRVRMVLLMTDGFIGNEDEILAETRRLRGGARVFGFGVGTSVNHYLLSRLSEEGRGFYQYVRPDEDSSDAVNRFVRRVRRPLITDITVDWGGLPVADVLPDPFVDLFDAQPLIIQGRYRNGARGTVTLKGRRGTQNVVFEVPVTFDTGTDGRALSMAWARKRIEKLSASQYGTPRADAIDQITAIGLEYHLVTPYTSLVAVEQERVTNVAPVTVTEPTLAADPSSAVAVTTPTVPSTGVPKPPTAMNPYGGGTVPNGAANNGLLGALKGKGHAGVGTGELNNALNGTFDSRLGTGGEGGQGQGSLGMKGTGVGGGGFFKTGGADVSGALEGQSGAGRGRGGGKLGYVSGVKGNDITITGGDVGGTTKLEEGRYSVTVDAPPKADPAPAKPKPAGPPVVAAKPEEPKPAKDTGDDFSYAFGAPRNPPTANPNPNAGKKSVYIPPAPGQTKETLSQSDLFEGVLGRKHELAACVALKEAGTTGTIVMEWSITPDGHVKKVAVAVQSANFKGTPVAECFARVIKTMLFARSRVATEHIQFPFKF
ncbi:MAG: VIT domain-containing protein [Archangium sp.]